MSRLEDLENYESELEAKEDEAEAAEQKFEEVSNRLEAIENAIGKLTDDREVAESLEANKTEAENEKTQAEQEKANLIQELQSMQTEFQEITAENENSASALSELSGIGEDVSEAMGVVESRREQIKNGESKIQELINKLQS